MTTVIADGSTVYTYTMVVTNPTGTGQNTAVNVRISDV